MSVGRTQGSMMAFTAKQIVGSWRIHVPEGVPVTSYTLAEDGQAESVIDFGGDQPVRQLGTWEFDGVRRWKVKIPRKSRSIPFEEIDYDVVSLNAQTMDCTNWDDDGIVIRFERIG